MAELYPDGILRNVLVTTDVNGNTIVSPTVSSEIILSKSQAEVVDMISEGPIKGLVTGKYSYSGNLGEVGWRSAIFSGYKIPTNYSNIEYLRSVYLNQIPILDDLGKFNFNNINLSFTNGNPNGEAIRTLSPYQSSSRSIGERLRGGDNNSKTYRIFNKDCKAIIIAIKIASLSRFSEGSGQSERTQLVYSFYYRPIFSNKSSINAILLWSFFFSSLAPVVAE